ncbi:hypothetical protein F5Y17DRAFT_425052 [Xylariaceae sp. FL0594]|nr:hypothetical protein F5Y17DRAFT_425052 [Xylariaceae sp. FL0594]
MSPHLPRQDQQPLADLAGAYREFYRSQVRARVAAGDAIPFVIPLHLVTYFLVPTLYLAIPHKERPWLYRTRWLVLAFVTGFNWYLASNTVSLNFATGYAAGLLPAWGVIWNFTLLAWTRPQWDAKRVVRRRKERKDGHINDGTLPVSPRSHGPNGYAQKPKANGFAASAEETDTKKHVGESLGNGVRRRGGDPEFRRVMAPGVLFENMQTTEEEKSLASEIRATNESDGNPPLDNKTLLRLCRLARENEYEYYWQEYPANASIWTRLSWSLDLVSSIRMTGWNWAPSCLPPYEPPPKIGDYYQLPLEYGVHRTEQGFERTVSRAQLIFSRWLYNVVPSYVVLDLCTTLMTMDPYFIAGPEQSYPLPAHILPLHPNVLFAQRTLMAFAGILSALYLYWNAGALLLAMCCPPLLGFRAHPWLMPSMTGSITHVLDRGLAGFWGTWWHQSFRFGFAAPGKWLLRNGYLRLGSRTKNESPSKASVALDRAIAAGLAFAQSGLIHGAGSYGTPWPSRPWHPPLFFALSFLGTVIQATLLSHLLPATGGNEGRNGNGMSSREKMHRFVRRSANLTFACVWLAATGWLLVEDLSRCGVWLFEPVPVSLFRAAGYDGGSDDRVWRWDRDSLPSWHWGVNGRWWETGIAI